MLSINPSLVSLILIKKPVSGVSLLLCNVTAFYTPLAVVNETALN